MVGADRGEIIGFAVDTSKKMMHNIANKRGGKKPGTTKGRDMYGGYPSDTGAYLEQMGIPGGDDLPEPVECETCIFFEYDGDTAVGICKLALRRELIKANAGATRHEPTESTLAKQAAAAIVSGDDWCEDWESHEESQRA